jgi:hypothetical protein
VRGSRIKKSMVGFSTTLVMFVNHTSWHLCPNQRHAAKGPTTTPTSGAAISSNGLSVSLKRGWHV